MTTYAILQNVRTPVNDIFVQNSVISLCFPLLLHDFYSVAELLTNVGSDFSSCYTGEDNTNFFYKYTSIQQA